MNSGFLNLLNRATIRNLFSPALPSGYAFHVLKTNVLNAKFIRQWYRRFCAAVDFVVVVKWARALIVIICSVCVRKSTYLQCASRFSIKSWSSLFTTHVFNDSVGTEHVHSPGQKSALDQDIPKEGFLSTCYLILGSRHSLAAAAGLEASLSQ